MTVKTVYVVRHGQRESHDSRALSPTGAAIDPPLKEAGIKQAEELAKHFSDNNINVDAILSSPYYRCLQSATPLADSLKLPIFVEHGLSEFLRYEPDGKVEEIARPPNATELKKHFPQVAPVSVYPSCWWATREGDTFYTLHRRLSVTIDLIVGWIETKKPAAETIVIFTHAAPAIALGRALLREETFTPRTGTASLSQYVHVSMNDSSEQHEFSVDSEAASTTDTVSGDVYVWKCAASGVTSHLSEGEKDCWTDDDVERWLYKEPAASAELVR